jgi:hypothetical protein
MNEFTTPEAQQTIQAILAPGLLISACGLLLLGLNNRYAIVINRIRTLNDEKRRRLSDPDAIDKEYVDMLRFESVMRQIPVLMIRSNHLRHALICLWTGVSSYLVTSLCLGVSFLFHLSLGVLAVSIFMCGILIAAVGVIFALLDIVLAQKVLRDEIDIY